MAHMRARVTPPACGPLSLGRMAAVDGISEAWIEAEAALPDGWEVRGVARGPREVDPQIQSAEWAAWARPTRPGADYAAIAKVEGRGETALEALHGLTRELREVGSR